MDTIVSISDLVQTLLLPLLACMLAWQAYFMGQIVRMLFEIRMRIAVLEKNAGMKFVRVNP